MATRVISRNIQQAAVGTSEVSTNIVDVQGGSTQTGRPPRTFYQRPSRCRTIAPA